MTEREAVETVAAGTGIVILPMSVARLHHRKDVVTRPVVDLAPTTRRPGLAGGDATTSAPSASSAWSAGGPPAAARW